MLHLMAHRKDVIEKWRPIKYKVLLFLLVSQYNAQSLFTSFNFALLRGYKYIVSGDQVGGEAIDLNCDLNTAYL
jgi:hypothetical protein